MQYYYKNGAITKEVNELIKTKLSGLEDIFLCIVKETKDTMCRKLVNIFRKFSDTGIVT